MFKHFAILVVLMTAVARAGTTDPAASDEKYLDYAKGFECVVQIEGLCMCGKDDGHMFHASAVAIAPNFVLTAAHVVKDGESVSIRIGDKKFRAVDVIVNEEFKEDNVGYFDIAICRCEGDFGLGFYPGLYEESDEVSKIASMAGFGMTGKFSTGYTKSDRKKRAGSNIISRSERDVLVCDLFDRKTSLEFLIAPGDSGGGFFIENKLAGINSFVMAADGKTDSDYGDESAHTRISKFVPWIKSKMENR